MPTTGNKGSALKTRCSLQLSPAFLIREEDIHKLYQLFHDRIGKVGITADCADDATREFKDAKALVSYQNTKPKEIIRIQLSARSDDFSKRVELDLHGSRWRGVTLDIHANDIVTSRLRSDTLDILEGMRPWYGILQKVDFVSLAFLAYFVFLVALLVLFAFEFIPSDDSAKSTTRSSALGQLILYGGLAALVVTGFIFNKLRDKVFPRSAFLLGQGKERYRNLERFQWGVVISFLASLAAGLVIVLL